MGQASTYPSLSGGSTLNNQGLLPVSPAVMSPAGGASAQGLNVIEFEVFQVLVSSIFNEVCFGVGTASGNVDVGIYDSTGTGGSPGARLTHSGSTPCPAAGAQAVAVPPVTLPPGRYFTAVVFDNLTATTEFGAGLFVQDAIKARYNQTAFPLPATATPTLNVSSASCFQIWPSHS